jgi:hypothetical protein
MATIKDPILEPFYIGKDNYCYTVYEVVTPDAKNLEKGSKGKIYEKPIGHYSKFATALECAAKAKVANGDQVYSSVKEYIESWNEIQEQIKQLLDVKI